MKEVTEEYDARCFQSVCSFIRGVKLSNIQPSDIQILCPFMPICAKYMQIVAGNDVVLSASVLCAAENAWNM